MAPHHFTELVWADKGALAEPVPQLPLPWSLHSQPMLLNQELPPLARRSDQFCSSTLHKPIMFIIQAESNYTPHQAKIPKPLFFFLVIVWSCSQGGLISVPEVLFSVCRTKVIFGGTKHLEPPMIEKASAQHDMDVGAVTSICKGILIQSLSVRRGESHEWH